MPAAVAATPRPMSVSAVLARPKLDGKPVTIVAQMVHTTMQQNDTEVPKNQYRVSDQVFCAYRDPGSPHYIAGSGTSIQLTGASKGALDALIAAEAAQPGPLGPKDDGYNSAVVSVQGVLNLGSGNHDSTLAVTKVEPAPIGDLMNVLKKK